MVKLSTFLNTSRTTPLLESASADNVSRRLAGGGLEAQSQLVSSKLSEARGDKARARAEGLRAQQIKAQSQFQLNNIFGQLEQSNLKAVTTLAIIDEQNRMQREKEMAAAYNMKASTDLALGFQQFYTELKNTAAADGSDMLPKVQEWVNSRIADIEKNAPNDQAIADFKAIASKALVNYSGQALEDAERRRTEYVLENTASAVDNMKIASTINPGDAPDLTLETNIQQMTSLVNAQNLPAPVKERQIKAYKQSLVASQVDGLVKSGRFADAKTIAFESVVGQQALTYDQAIKMSDSILKAERAYLESSAQINLVSQSMAMIKSGNMSRIGYENLPAKARKDIGMQYSSDLMSVLANPNSSIDEKSQQAFNLISESKFMIPELGTTIEGLIRDSDDPTAPVLLSNVINTLAENPKTAPLIEGLDKNTVREAQIIASRASFMPAKEAVTIAREIARKEVKLDPVFLKNFKEDLVDRSASSITKAIAGNYFMSPDVFNEAQIKAEFDMLAAQELAITNDPKIAKETALNILKSKYTVSEINGREEILEASPEQIYGDGTQLQQFINIVGDKANSNNPYGLKFDMENREVIEMRNGSEIRYGFRIIPVPGVTREQIKNRGGSQTTWQLVNMAPGFESDVFATVTIDKLAIKDRLIESHAAQLQEVSKITKESKVNIEDIIRKTYLSDNKNIVGKNDSAERELSKYLPNKNLVIKKDYLSDKVREE